MFVAAVCFLFLLKLRWSKNKSVYDLVYERYGHEALKILYRSGNVSYQVSLFLYNGAVSSSSYLVHEEKACAVYVYVFSC